MRDRVTNETLQKMSGVTDPARLKDDRWTYKATMWDPHTGRRSRGRPRQRWADLFKELAGRQWSSRARNRNDWKVLRRQVNSD